MAGHEKRENQRVPMDMPVRYTLDGKTWSEARSKDVSPSGMLLQTSSTVEPGLKLIIRFNLPNLKFQEPITTEVEVVRVVNNRGRQIGLGLRFNTIQAAHYQVIEEFVHRVLGIGAIDGFEALGEKTKSGYTFTVDRLAREAQERQERAMERKMGVKQPRPREQVVAKWVWTAAKITIVIGGSYLLFKAAMFVYQLLSRLNNLGN